MDINEVSERLRSISAKRKESESENQYNDRFKKTIARRDQAINKIREYQKQTGIPNDDEVDSLFLKDSGIGATLEEFREKEETTTTEETN